MPEADLGRRGMSDETTEDWPASWMHETLRPADGHCRDDVAVRARPGRNGRR